MTYSKDQVVKVRKSSGEYVTGTVMEQADFNTGETLYWVRYVDSQHNEVGLISEGDLDKWNNVSNSDCQCGSYVLKHPGHSTWCNLFG